MVFGEHRGGRLWLRGWDEPFAGTRRWFHYPGGVEHFVEKIHSGDRWSVTAYFDAAAAELEKRGAAASRSKAKAMPKAMPKAKAKAKAKATARADGAGAGSAGAAARAVPG